MMDLKFAGKPIRSPNMVSRIDLDQMPDTPNRGAHHRRAQSETFFRFPDVDDILLDDVVLPDFNIDLSDIPITTTIAVDSSNKSDSSNGPDYSNSEPKPRPTGPNTHCRSLSVGDDFFDGLGFTSLGGGADGDDVAKPPEKRRGGYHRHSNSMDGSSTAWFEAESMGMMVDSAKKAMGPDKLAELALIDPKRAKRVLANRQSAARSKERKIRYTSELERKVQTLQTEATTLSAQVTVLQRDTTGLNAENKELKLRLQAMEEHAHLREALNEALREEVQRLKISAGQIAAVNGSNFNRELPPQFSSHQQTFHHMGNHQVQQPQQQLHMPHSLANNQNLAGQLQHFNQRV